MLNGAGLVALVVVAGTVLYLLSERSGTSSGTPAATTVSQNPVTTTVPGGPTTTETPGGSATLAAPPAGDVVAGDTPCPSADGSAKRTTSFAKPPPMCIDKSKKYSATMSTSKGDVTFALDPAGDPASVNNFVVLARYHFYDGIPFHRIVPDFVIQAGDSQGEPWGTHGPGYEFTGGTPSGQGVYTPGVVAMANSSGPSTNGSQFFIVTGKQAASLDSNYSVLGKVTAGLDVATGIGALGKPDGTPTEAVTIKTITITEA